jgi:hypothetical protein
MKKVLFGFLAVAALAGCAKEADKGGLDYNPIGENSYMAINLQSPAPASKAADGVYEDDASAETTPKTAHFFFFDANGNPYAVANGTNCLEKNLAKAGNAQPNVEWKSETVLVIEKTSTIDPKWVIAVLNAPAGFRDQYNAKPMAELKAAELTSYYGAEVGGVKSIVMSNSVYKNEAGAEVYEVEILPENLGETEAAAKVTPITMYVERVCAKVRVENADLIKVTTDGTTAMKDSKDNEVYAKILGWQVTNNISETTLKKSIDVAWSDTQLGFTWNDVPYFRSYWAQTKATLDPVHAWTWNDLKTHNVASDYYFENTLESTLEDNGVDATNTPGNAYPQLLVAVEFVNAAGEKLDLAKWYGRIYTLADLKTAIANDFSLRIFVEDGALRTSIAPADLDYYQVADDVADNRYECILKVAATSESKKFVDAAGAALTLEQVNAELAKVSPAQIWKEGGYYYTPIRHLGTAGSKGEFGMVRNHLYDITISAVQGLGTPVYDPSRIITPEKPEDDQFSYIAAQINVLAWRVIQQDVTLL